MTCEIECVNKPLENQQNMSVDIRKEQLSP
jgi:hypothetical protein